MCTWTEEAPSDESRYAAVTSEKWAYETIDAISGGPEDRRATAIATLHELADCLDDPYDGGFHGIAPMPLAECNMGWDW
jgi:hypothetical protein